MATYKVLISPASDPGNFIAELPFSDLSWSETLNEVGEASVSLPLRGGSLETVAGNLAPGKTCLWIDRNGSLRFGGIVWTASGSVDGNSLDISASDFHSYTRRREIRSTTTFTAVDQLTIARTLIDNLQDTAGSLDIIQTTETSLSGVLRDRTYLWYERLGVGEAIENLASVNDGFDWRYVVAYSAGVPTVEFTTSFPKLGFRTPYVFDLGSNVELLSFTEDGTSLVNRAEAIGIGEGEAISQALASLTNSAALLEYPLYERSETFNDIYFQSTLEGKARLMLARGAKPITQYTVRLSPDAQPRLGSYKVGDIVQLRGEYGYLSVADDFRIVSLAYSVGTDGEVVEATLTNLEAFDDI